MGLLLKLLIFGVAAYTVWTTMRRWLGLLGGTNKSPPPVTSRRAPASAPPSQAQSPSGPAPAAARRPIVEDTRACPVCAAYVSLSAATCGRPDCPQT